eukprot:TRINITY_DN8686_c0_g1_i1.p1 TRINITY_DN8686_c0_g1~~TRINITY_DN8686_c0_g1_i1.p1  ORF type:complete len:195 (+),score=80.59 TRINITY_DN8686_c0_g1_i1:208-792(+)
MAGADDGSITHALKRVWQNEAFAPEILPFETQVVTEVRSLLSNQEQVIADLASSDNFTSNVLQMELDRVRYCLSSYLRCRLVKIEKFSHLIDEDEEVQELLAEEEVVYARKFSRLVHRHLKSSFLDALPRPFAGTRDLPVLSVDVDKHVLCVVAEDIGDVQFDREDLELERGNMMLARYSHLRTFLFEDKVQLL